MKRSGPTARAVALAALSRIEQGAYANLVLSELLDRSGLDRRDRALATELVYGTTRMRRACDWLVDRFVLRPLDPDVRSVLRLGAYQVVFMEVPDHAAVSATVALAPGRARGLVNAVLRRVAAAGPPDWPDEATRLSYPDWILGRLRDDLGAVPARASLEAMNRPPPVTGRADGYVQDLASQWVVDAVGVRPGERVADVCAGPGGKATGLASGAAVVAALDIRAHRARLVRANAVATNTPAVVVAVADARRVPLRTAAFDRVLVDAPCSGLGVLRRRPDARWRITEGDIADLAALQQLLVLGAAPLVRPGGTLTYSVCTVTAAETLGVDGWMGLALDGWAAVEPPGHPWTAAGRGARLLPHDADTDGMFMVTLRAPQPR